MNQSECIAELSAALAKAQAVMEGAAKDSANPFFKSKYADLSAVWDACRKPLTDNGLSVVQTADFMPDHPDMVCIETVLCHSSGEWIRGRLAVKPVKADPQSVGSCITYLRRYSLQSMVGIAPEDDDGNAASGNEGKKEAKKAEPPKAKTPQPKQEQQAPAPEPPCEYPEFADPAPPHLKPGSPLHKKIEASITEAGMDRDSFKTWLYEKGKIELKDGKPSMSTMAEKDAQAMVDMWSKTVTNYNTWKQKAA
jgi:hypothetical protein